MKIRFHHALTLAVILASAGSVAHADSFNLNNIDLPSNDFIVGGQVVSPDDPVAATTVLITDGNFICTGSLIDTDTVVTAAHCTAAKVSDLRVVFSTDLHNVSQSHVLGITGLQANPGWQGEKAKGVDQHDIALLHLNGSLPDGYHAANLLSADESENLRRGDEAVLAGFGITDAQSQQGAGVLRKVEVSIAKKLGKTEVVLDQRDGKGACHGDSGGPAFTADGLLWGVTNRGYPNNAPDNCVHYAVYTRIQAYADWIATTETALRNNR